MFEFKTITKIMLLILGFFFYCPAHSVAQNFGVIEQTVSAGFKPVSTYALVAQKLSSNNWRFIKRIHGIILPADEEKSVNVAIIVPKEIFSEDEQELYYSFFLLSLDGEIAATEVKTISKEQLLNSFIPKEQLTEEIKQFEQQLPVLKTKNIISQNRLNQTKEKASRIAEVDDLIDLKSELENLKETDSDAISEMQNLKILYATNVYKPNAPEDLQMRMDLEKKLREIILLTTFHKKVESNSPAEIIANFQKKIDLVKSAENINPETLAREVLALRKKRLELESKINSNGTDLGTSGNRDF